jgi:tripartite-type tricarboxylate transporter receptor subunit TctC
MRTFAVLLGGLLLAALPARASDDYPNRAVTFVVPFAAGGSTSLIARIMAQKLEQRLGKPFVVDNRPGSGGMIAVSQVAHGTPDGYTIMMASSTALAINVNVRKQLPYDPRKDITPVALIARMPYVLVVNPDLPVKSVADLVKLAKDKPGQLSFASVGPGTIHHLNAELFKSIFGLDIVHVPYKGTAPALQDVVGGHVPFMFSDVPPARALIDSGKLRALGVTTAERVGVLPEVPPLAEAGIPNYNTASWHSISTAAGVPKGIVDKLAAEIREISQDAEVRRLLSAEGAIPQTSPPPDELKRFVDAEIVRWGELVQKAGILHSQ